MDITTSAPETAIDPSPARSRVALVTGANRGLGLATARRLGQAGLTVVVAARDEPRSRDAVRQLREEGLYSDAIPLDVDDPVSVREAAGRIRRDYRRLDVLVNNAGILPEATTHGADRPLDVGLFERTHRTNVLGAVAVTQALLPLLTAAPGGRIVNVSSTMGSLVDQLDPQSPWHAMIVPAYQTSKAALNALTVVLSKALADSSVKVNSVCPGWVQTDLAGAEGRAAAPTTAEDAAEVVARAALLGPDGPTGSFFDLDGPVPW